MIGKVHEEEGLQLVLAALFAWQVGVPDSEAFGSLSASNQ
jgi:hypothetical protein